MHEGCLHEKGQFCLWARKELFDCGNAFHQFLGWRRNKCSVAGPRATDPVLGLAEFAGPLLAAAPFGQENLVNLPYQTERQREIFSQSAKTGIHRCPIIYNVLNTFQRYARGFGAFKQHQVRKRRLCALYLRREHGFLSNVEVNEERGVWQNGRESVQAPECLVRLLKQRQERLEGQRRVRGQRRGHVGPERLVLECFEDVSSEAAVGFGWRWHHKTIVSLEISLRNYIAFLFR